MTRFGSAFLRIAAAAALLGALIVSDTPTASADPPIVARRSAQMQAARNGFTDMPREAVRGYPVPFADADGLWLGYIFFLRQGRPPDPPQYTAPGWVARIDVRTGEAVQLRRYENVDLTRPLGRHVLPKDLDMAAFKAAEAELYAALTTLLPLAQFPDKQLTPAEEAAAAEFPRLWKLLAHKPLQPYYKALNPAFFDRLGL